MFLFLKVQSSNPYPDYSKVC